MERRGELTSSQAACYDNAVNAAIRLVKSFINLLYPLHCASCGKHLESMNSDGACEFCISQIKRNPAPYCRICGRSWSPTQEMQDKADPCPECRKMDPCFGFARSSCLYEGSIKELIHKFKYKNVQILSSAFTKIMLDFINDNGYIIDGIDMITFVPLHKKRALERAFNQSEKLAVLLGKELEMPVIGCLEKRFATKNQNELTREDRLVNVKGAFRIIPGVGNKITGRGILIIDDVMTTGATLNETSRTLISAGAANVRCLTLARGN